MNVHGRSVGEVLSQHVNSQGEMTTIEKVKGGEFAGQHLLCIYDDATPTIAMTLLDEGLRDWLMRSLQPSTATSSRPSPPAAGNGGRT